jgi:hypothetical protein
MLLMGINKHKTEFQEERNRILIGFLLVLLACLLFVVKIKLVSNKEKPGFSNKTSELFATWQETDEEN